MKSNTINETNHSPSKDDEATGSPPPPPPPFFGTILEQVLQFVLPKDVARVSMVCKTWRDNLLSKKDTPPPNETTSAEHGAPPYGDVSTSAVWKQAAINSNPSLIQATIEATKSGGKKTEAEIDFRALAKSDCLCREHKKTDELPEPTFQIENLLIVLEIKREKVVLDENGQEKVSLELLGTFYESGSEDFLDIWCVGHFDLTKRPAIVVEGQNPLCPDSYNGNVVLWENAKTSFHTQFNARVRENRVPFVTVGTTVLSKLVVSVTLVRLDDSRSFILVDNKKMPNLNPD
jgi:F-box domain